MQTKITALSFLWSIIKPYKYLYLVMMIAPLTIGPYLVMLNYAVKLLLDLFTQNEHITFAQAYTPVMYFIMAHVIQDCAWRAHNFAQLKAMPYILQNMTQAIYKHCFDLPYTYFQNNLSGSIIGKVGGIGDKYMKIHQAMEFQLSRPLLVTLFSGFTLGMTNIKVFAFAALFTLIYLPLALKFFGKLAKMEQAKQDSWYSHKIKDSESFKEFFKANMNKTSKDLAKQWGNISSVTILRQIRKLGYSYKKNLLSSEKRY